MRKPGVTQEGEPAALQFRQALLRQFRRGERCLFLLVTVSALVVRRRGLKVTNWTYAGFGALRFRSRATSFFSAICF